MRLKQSLLSFVAFLGVLGMIFVLMCVSSPGLNWGASNVLMLLSTAYDMPFARQSVDLMRMPAEQGNSDAQSMLGSCYFIGFGVVPDYQQAVHWLEKAAVAGDRGSQFMLAYGYLRHAKSPQEYGPAIKWFTKAAEQGSESAAFFVSKLYRLGIGVPQNLSEAFRFEKLSAEHGQADGQFELARMYQFGTGTKIDEKLAAKWYARAADQGLPGAKFAVAVDLIKHAGKAHTPSRALSLIHTAAEHGYFEAQLASAEIAAFGLLDQPANLSEAQKWLALPARENMPTALYLLNQIKNAGKQSMLALATLEKEANTGNRDAQALLADLCQNGLGEKQDYAKALSLYQNAASQGQSDAQFFLANSYLTGSGGLPCDVGKGIDLLEKSAAADNALAEDRLSYAYSIGEGVRIDPAKELDLLKRAVSHGFPDAKYAYAMYYALPDRYDKQHVLTYLTQAANDGDVHAQDGLATWLFKNGGSIKEMAKWRLAAAEQGYVPSLLALAQMYNLGIGVNLDTAKANKLVEKAAQQGDLTAIEEMAGLYAAGLGDAPPDNETALAMYRRCAEAGDSKSQYHLGEKYYEGIGVAEDRREAKKWFELAAAQGNQDAREALTQFQLVSDETH